MSTLKKYSRLIFMLLTCAFGMAALAACEEQGPLEVAGEKADEAVKDAERTVKDVTD